MNTEINLAQIVREKVNATLNNQKNEMVGAFIEEIHPDINVKYNSVNVIVGKQGQGKTVIALQEIIKIGIMNTHHLLIYVTKDGNESDRSFLALKPLIEPYIPILTVSENDAQKTIENIIQKKNEYYKIKRNNLVDSLNDPDLKISPDETQDIFDKLYIDGFDYDYLHTIVLFDDISNSKLFSNESSYFSQLIRRCRHTNFSFFLLIQGWKGLKSHIKNEISTLFIFPCFNKQQLHYIYSQSATNLDFDEFYAEYYKIMQIKTKYPNSHPYLVIQVADGGDTFAEL
ncbi:hypothetical protein [uncultured Brachyspira sp.]|uniref:hypothetical protein n=1 Tax=uncultured Brachyspira sp. TaxID=221953 RepID=UPI0026373A94|nr:hypothetical protein [uncultured Brachyspira sp.]